MQLVWLAAAVFIVAAGYGRLLPLLPGWLVPIVSSAFAGHVGRHVGFVNGVYAVDIFVRAPLWWLVSDRVGRRKILIIGLVGFVGFVGSLLAILVPAFGGLHAIFHSTAGEDVCAYLYRNRGGLGNGKVDCAGCQPSGVFHVFGSESYCCQHWFGASRYFLPGYRCQPGQARRYHVQLGRCHRFGSSGKVVGRRMALRCGGAK